MNYYTWFAVMILMLANFNFQIKLMFYWIANGVKDVRL